MAEGPEVPDLEVDIPMPGGLKITADAPYHMLVLSDLAGSAPGSISGELESGVVTLTADTFDEVMAGACPRVNYTTDDPLGAGKAMVEVDLRFDSLRAFDPKNLVRQITATGSLMDVRA